MQGLMTAIANGGNAGGNGNGVDVNPGGGAANTFDPSGGFADLGAGEKGHGIYLNAIFFDKDMNYKKAVYKKMSDTPKENGENVEHEKLDIAVPVEEEGYMYVYYSNESATMTEAYYDDFSVTLVQAEIIQADYYPFGLTFNSYQRAGAKDNKYLMNGKERMDDLDLNWDDFGARIYMPEIGRWSKIDPLAEKFYSHSPYNYAFNNPIRFVDNNGEEPIDPRTGKPVDLDLYNAAVFDTKFIRMTNNSPVMDRELYARANEWPTRARGTGDYGSWYNRHETNWEHTPQSTLNALSNILPSGTPGMDYTSPNDYMWREAAELGTYIYVDDTYAESEFWQINQMEFNIVTVEENYITSIVNLTRPDGDGEFTINSVTNFEVEKGETQTREVKTWGGGTRTEKYRTLTVTESSEKYKNNKTTGEVSTKTYTREEKLKDL